MTEPLAITLWYDDSIREWRAYCDGNPSMRARGISPRQARHRLLSKLGRKRGSQPLALTEQTKLPTELANRLEAHRRKNDVVLELDQSIRSERLELAKDLLSLRLSQAGVAQCLGLAPQHLGTLLCDDTLGRIPRRRGRPPRV